MRDRVPRTNLFADTILWVHEHSVVDEQDEVVEAVSRDVGDNTFTRFRASPSSLLVKLFCSKMV